MFPGGISNFASVGAYLEGSLAVGRVLKISDPVIPLLEVCLWKESQVLTLAHVHCSFIDDNKKLEIAEYSTTGEHLSTLGYRYLKELSWILKLCL